MSIAITISSTIDGSGKTMVSYVLTQLLSSNYKILALDLSGQCDLTETLIREPTYQTETNTIWEAFEAGNISSFIFPVTENLHVLPGNTWIGSIPASLYMQGKKEKEVVITLRDLFNQAKTGYDFIVIDSPSTSALELFNLSLAISDFAIMTYSPSQINRINQWLTRTIDVQKNFNSNLRVGGILRTRFNKMESMHKYIETEVLEYYPNLCWSTAFPNDFPHAILDIAGKKKKETIVAFKAIYDELILRLLKR